MIIHETRTKIVPHGNGYAVFSYDLGYWRKRSPVFPTRLAAQNALNENMKASRAYARCIGAVVVPAKGEDNAL